MKSNRVVEIWVDASPEPKRGSGYLLSTGCVLTAYHVIAEARFLPEVRRLGMPDWCDAAVLWKDATLDLALLELPSSETLDILRVVPAQNFERSIDCSACGFPSFERVKIQEKTVCREYLAEGWVKATDLTATKTPGELQMEIRGGIPAEITDWQGISGAMVFADCGSAIGVLLECPGKLQGQQLRLISLGWVLENCPDLRDRLGQSLELEQSIEERQKEIYRVEQELYVLKSKNIENDALRLKLENDLEELQGHQQLVGHNPEQEKLKRALMAIGAFDPDLLGNAWIQSSAAHVWLKPDVRDIHARLCTSKDETLAYRFLDRTIGLLQRKDPSQDPSDEISKLIRELSDIQRTFPPRSATPATPTPPKPSPAPDLNDDDSDTSHTPLLLFGLTRDTELQGAIGGYTLSVYHVSDSAAYQQQIRDEQSLEETSQPLAFCADELSEFEVQQVEQNSVTLMIEPADDVDALKEILTATVQVIFDTYPDIAESQPHLYFYLPQSLLTLDCHNLDCDDGLSSLGLDYPVVMSCFERHQQSPRSKKVWRKRWEGLNGEPQKPLHRHVCSCDEQPNGKPLNFENKKALGKQLKQLDLQGATLVGLRFAGNDFDFHRICDTLFATGLSLFLYPTSPLTPSETANLSQALEKNCVDRFLMALKDEYRVNTESDDDAGSLAVLLDNPDLPLPELDYF